MRAIFAETTSAFAEAVQKHRLEAQGMHKFMLEGAITRTPEYHRYQESLARGAFIRRTPPP
jgi:hypothetical protein